MAKNTQSIADRKAQFAAEVSETLAQKGPIEAKLGTLLELAELGETIAAAARAGLSDTLKAAKDGDMFEIGGLPYKAYRIRNTGTAATETEEAVPLRLGLRCAISKSLQSRYDLKKKA